jgi:hypothetical protein
MALHSLLGRFHSEMKTWLKNSKFTATPHSPIAESRSFSTLSAFSLSEWIAIYGSKDYKENRIAMVQDLERCSLQMTPLRDIPDDFHDITILRTRGKNPYLSAGQNRAFCKHVHSIRGTLEWYEIVEFNGIPPPPRQSPSPPSPLIPNVAVRIDLFFLPLPQNNECS